MIAAERRRWVNWPPAEDVVLTDAKGRELGTVSVTATSGDHLSMIVDPAVGLTVRGQRYTLHAHAHLVDGEWSVDYTQAQKPWSSRTLNRPYASPTVQAIIDDALLRAAREFAAERPDTMALAGNAATQQAAYRAETERAELDARRGELIATIAKANGATVPDLATALENARERLEDGSDAYADVHLLWDLYAAVTGRVVVLHEGD